MGDRALFEWLEQQSPAVQELILRDATRLVDSNQLAYYKPYPKQLEFHASGGPLSIRERLLKAGNQVGKTWSAGYEHAMHLTGRYPDWWNGTTFDEPVVGWAASETSQGTRDTVQRILMGELGNWGTGAIPRDAIQAIKRNSHGVADSIESIYVRYGGGGDVQAGTSRVTLKTYDQGRKRWQGETLDFVWFDEEPPLDIYTEGYTRTNARGGIVTLTFTPLLGMSEVVRRFLQEKDASRVVTNMTIHDAEHYTEEERIQIIASYPRHEREARVNGTPTMGTGRIYAHADEDIWETQFPIPAHWPRIAGIDFGWDHPTAVVWLALDRDNDVIHVYDAYSKSETIPAAHAVVINARGDWIPVAWPHDGEQHDKGSGEALATQYRAQKVAMLRHKATHRPPPGKKEGEGGNSVEAGIMEINQRMETGRFKVARHLTKWFEEFRLYHREESKTVPGQVHIVKLYDDMMDATRYAVMMLRHAKIAKAQARDRSNVKDPYQPSSPTTGAL